MTAASNVLDDIVDEYNNTYHQTIKMKPIDVILILKSYSYAEYSVESNEKDPKFKVGNHVRISKYKINFAKGYASNWSGEVFVISKTKKTVPWAYVICDSNGEEIVGNFHEKELQKTNQKEFRIEKVIKRKEKKLYVKWKGYDNSFNRWIDKKHCIKMSQYFPKPYRRFGRNINVKVDLSNYATKADLKNATGIDTSNFALKSNLASLKTEVDKSYTDKLIPVSVDLSKLSDVVKNDVVKRTVYDKLVTKVNNIGTSGFVLKTKYDTEKLNLEKEIPDTSGLVKKLDYSSKISEIESKIPSISGLATTFALTAVENKIPDV